MKYLTYHVKGSCDLEDLDDHEIKEILYPIDMNYQKTLYGMSGTQGYSNQGVDMKNRTDYFKTQAALDKANQKEQLANKTTVNFLNTNYRQTSKAGFYNPPK